LDCSALLKTLNADPIRRNCRTLILEPNANISRRDAWDPIFAIDLNEREEPIDTKLSTDMADPIRAAARNETDEPI
jgi:hypothetical protein